jgi:hypothetical protein
MISARRGGPPAASSSAGQLALYTVAGKRIAVYDLITLLLAQRTVTGAVIYDGYPSPGVNESCPTPLASEGCAVAAAYSLGTR